VPFSDLFEGEPEVLRDRLENMHEIICYLLLKNQELRMRLAAIDEYECDSTSSAR
jgi:hypothetical protein